MFLINPKIIKANITTLIKIIKIVPYLLVKKLLFKSVNWYFLLWNKLLYLSTTKTGTTSISKNPNIDEKYFINDWIFCKDKPIAIGGKATMVLKQKFLTSEKKPDYSAKLSFRDNSRLQPAIASKILFLKVINCIPDVITFNIG